MKVSELIEKLQSIDDKNLQVFFPVGDDRYSEKLQQSVEKSANVNTLNIVKTVKWDGDDEEEVLEVVMLDCF